MLFHPEIEAILAPDLRAHQERLWRRQWDHVREDSGFYRAKFGSSARRAATLDSLADLPLTDKDELRASQEQMPPYGDYVAAPPERIIRLHRTSGTTGRGMIVALGRADADIVAALGARAYWAAGLRPGDRVIHCLNYCLWTGGVTDHLILEATGATVVPFGVGYTPLLLRTMIELGVNAISCTPSYPALLEQVLRQELGMEPRELKLRLGLFAGEAGLDNPDFRLGLEERWGFAARNANFGMSEVMSVMGSQCEATNDLHFHCGDAVFAELLDPATGARLPIADGTTGELVCTNLDKEVQPLVRYRTRDIVTVTGAGPCACGRAAWRFRIAGRTDDMFNVRGVNVFPTAVQAVLRTHPALTSGECRVVLAGPGPYDRIAARAEAAESLSPQDWPAAKARLEAAIKSAIGAGAAIEIVPFGSLPRTAGKTSLVERK